MQHCFVAAVSSDQPQMLQLLVSIEVWEHCACLPSVVQRHLKPLKTQRNHHPKTQRHLFKVYHLILLYFHPPTLQKIQHIIKSIGLGQTYFSPADHSATNLLFKSPNCCTCYCCCWSYHRGLTAPVIGSEWVNLISLKINRVLFWVDVCFTYTNQPLTYKPYNLTHWNQLMMYIAGYNLILLNHGS